jgi:AraC-like DNA-binding protein
MQFSDIILQDSQIQYRFRHITKRDYSGFYHYHRGIEMLFVHRGIGHLVLNRKMYTLGPGSIMFIQPFQLHRVHFEVSEQNPYERTLLTFEPTSFLSAFHMFPSTRRFFEHMWKDELFNQVFQVSKDADMAYLSAVLEHFDHKLKGRSESEQQEVASMLIVALFEYLLPLAESGTAQRIPRTERHAETIMQWIEEHYAEPFSLDALAKDLHLSKHHISHLFRTETGSSITDYLIARRIRQACWLLKTESDSIEQVGAQVGIPNFSYFCRLFKKTTDLTPKEYRNHALLN